MDCVAKDQISCLLPGGYVDKSGAVNQNVVLAPLSGREEELLAGNHRRGSDTLITYILNQCIRSIDNINPVPEDVVRNLLIADRQYLLLKLREVTFGEAVQATIPCPWPDCGKKVDIDFSLENIPVIASEDKGPTYKMELPVNAAFESKHREVVFRLPVGGDQEEISPYLYENEAKALTMLLDRCIQSIGPIQNTGEGLFSRLSPLARMEIEKQMKAVAPRVELDMDGNCPECGREFTIPFDLQDFFFGEMRTSQDLLCREVHYLAYHYHWSEKEIMDMSREKRRNYIEVLADEIERMNNAV
jgi:hypothetical protein